jgi:polyhydroxybutyrate depolymerase
VADQLRRAQRFALAASALGLAALGACSSPLIPAVLRHDETQGLQAEVLQVDNRERRFYVYSPPGLPVHAPLLIAFHPSDSSAQHMREIAGPALERMARDDGFLLAYPDGFDGYFDDCRKQAHYRAHKEHIDDVAFSRALVAKLASNGAIDVSHVYALGYSNGAHMVLRLALEAPDLVAGIVAISANLPSPDNFDCALHDNGHPNVVLIEGTADPVNPFNGGEVSLYGLGGRGPVLSAPASARWFVQRYGLPSTPRERPTLHYQDLRAHIEVWSGDPAGPRVELISILGGGHTIPQAEYQFPVLLGRTFADPSPLQSAWEALHSPRP